jgi:Glycosyltransferase family 87
MVVLKARRMLPVVALPLMGVVGWVFFCLSSSKLLLTPSRVPPDSQLWQYDWHVYIGGAKGLIDQSLYRVPLMLVPYHLPVDLYNQMPLTAAWALPLSPLDVVTGGNVWLVSMLVCIGLGTILASAALGARLPALTAGLGLLVYTASPWFSADVLLGNINGLMFLLVAAFVWLHLQGKEPAAGLILGVAIATKPWALAFLPLLARERRWQEAGWAGFVLLAQGLAFLGWLGIDVAPQMVGAITSSVPVDPGVPVLGWSLVREMYHLPAWTGVALGAAMLAIPVRGRAGLGVAILAGLTLLVVNLWQHYLPVIALGVCLLMVPLAKMVRQAFFSAATR